MVVVKNVSMEKVRIRRNKYVTNLKQMRVYCEKCVYMKSERIM